MCNKFKEDTKIEKNDYELKALLFELVFAVLEFWKYFRKEKSQDPEGQLMPDSPHEKIALSQHVACAVMPMRCNNVRNIENSSRV